MHVSLRILAHTSLVTPALHPSSSSLAVLSLWRLKHTYEFFWYQFLFMNFWYEVFTLFSLMLPS